MSPDQYKNRVEQLDNEARAYLRSKGWKYTSDTPGGYWMWQKEIDGRVFLVEVKTAMRLQSFWDARDKYPDGVPSSRRPSNDDDDG